MNSSYVCNNSTSPCITSSSMCNFMQHIIFRTSIITCNPLLCEITFLCNQPTILRAHIFHANVHLCLLSKHTPLCLHLYATHAQPCYLSILIAYTLAIFACSYPNALALVLYAPTSISNHNHTKNGNKPSYTLQCIIRTH
jgi:hypothetical protein